MNDSLFLYNIENVLAHDEDYEKMWALHMMPLGVMAIGTGIFVKGRALAQMSMLAPSVLIDFCIFVEFLHSF